jgi:hypothetical protein
VARYLFYEKIHVQQKVILFMGDGPSFYIKRHLKTLASFFGFLDRRMPGTHAVCVDKVEKTKWSSGILIVNKLHVKPEQQQWKLGPFVHVWP